jgi:hypothetical protein
MYLAINLYGLQTYDSALMISPLLRITNGICICIIAQTQNQKLPSIFRTPLANMYEH